MNIWERDRQKKIAELKEELSINPELEEHLKDLADAFYKNLDSDINHLGLDGKRPFGNSDIESDIIRIINLDVDYDDEVSYDSSCQYCYELYRKLPFYLIICWERYNETL